MNTLEWRMGHGYTHILGSLFTFAVDGTEQEINKPNSSTHLDCYFFSSKKDMHSINILIICALDGTILYLSCSYGGAFNDDYIVRKEGYNWVKILEEIENGVGDSAFSCLTQYKLFSVPANRNEVYSLMSSHRIIVENVIADVKDFQICNQKLRYVVNESKSILKKHNKNWTIGSAFVNKYNKRKRYTH